MKIPFLNLGKNVSELRNEISFALSGVLNQGIYLLGPELIAFEAEWANWLGVNHAVGVANGLDALRLSLIACGVKSGDEVIVPANTYIATWLAISQIGAVPVPIEPIQGGFTIDPSRIAEFCTSKTKAIMPVHLYGHPAEMDDILKISDERKLMVIEDAAQCHGAKYKGKYIGGHGHAVAWSFYPTKNLGAFGDAGAVTTNNSIIADRIRVLRNYGQQQRYVCEEIGWNSRLDEIQAAVLRVKLRKLNEWNDRRKAIANIYLHGLSDSQVDLPKVNNNVDSVWHLFVIRHSKRDLIQRKLREMEIDTIIHYPIPPHRQNAYRHENYNDAQLPLTEKIHNEVLSLPCNPNMSETEANCIVKILKEILNGI